ncbi:MAG: UDP-N-acetylmuramoyl-L-alanyl-D-glutamate--2,6-diaminopimelate ligase [Campylobacter sp.]|nr:UDP-N-acetylmuramoyl-L-alanyl-D-glutamate--2,6-diaminopimelate ligase [Campylobacter sp.]
MKIQLQDNFITDNTKELENGAYFLKTELNKKYLPQVKNATIINADEAKKLLNIDPNLKVVGITGTNGKTTTAAAIYSALLDLGYKAMLIGTRGAFIDDKQVAPKALTTAMVLENLHFLKLASEAKCDFVVMEVSSHAISQNRIDGIDFTLKIFTNLSQDHLDYHKTFEEYARVKSSFFEDESLKLINKDDKFIRYNPKNAYTYSLQSPASFSVKAYSLKLGINALISSLGNDTNLESSLVGEFNLYNLLAAFGALKLITKKPDDEIAGALNGFGGVRGRVEVVANNPLIIVDFAHTPDGMQKVLSALKSPNIITVFGAGGDRDKTKRPLMGQIAKRYSKLAIVTSDNPRSEEKEAIIADIVAGINDRNSLIIEPDRKEAIKKAISLAKADDIIAILGKGDEDYQEIKGVKHHFSDKECVLEILKDRDEN